MKERRIWNMHMHVITALGAAWLAAWLTAHL